MEEIAVMNHMMVTNDEMSDDSISLDLHVSDTDESEECSTKKFDGEEKVFTGKLLRESEDDILNKYIADSSPSLERKKRASKPIENGSFSLCNGASEENSSQADDTLVADKDESASEEISARDDDLDCKDAEKKDSSETLCNGAVKTEDEEEDASSRCNGLDESVSEVDGENEISEETKDLERKSDIAEEVGGEEEEGEIKDGEEDKTHNTTEEVGEEDDEEEMKEEEEDKTDSVGDANVDEQQVERKPEEMQEEEKSKTDPAEEDIDEEMKEEEEEEEGDDDDTLVCNGFESESDGAVKTVPMEVDEDRPPSEDKDAVAKAILEKMLGGKKIYKDAIEQLFGPKKAVEKDVRKELLEEPEKLQGDAKNRHSEKKTSNEESEVKNEDKISNGEKDVLKGSADERDGVLKESDEVFKECLDGRVNTEDDKDVKAETADKPRRDEKTEESEECDDLLLQVLDEKSVEEAERETKDENSCSSSEKDEESRDNQEESSRDNQEESSGDNQEEASADNNDELKDNADVSEEPKDIAEESLSQVEEAVEENGESQVDIDMEAGECPMDIEENDIGAIFTNDSIIKNGAIIETSVSEKVKLRREDSVSIDIEDDVLSGLDSDANKENEDTAVNKKKNEKTKATEPIKSSDKDTANVILTNGICDDVEMLDGVKEHLAKTISEKGSKRHLSDDSSENDSTKRMRLETPSEDDAVKPPSEQHKITRLGSFKQFMLDKKLKSLTRFELEELCMQKMCECIVNRSEIGELRQRIKVQEQAIDTWRKEAVVVAKQTRDLKIVHERLMTDLKAIKEQTGKPLVPVKITRSVGLQAIIENTNRPRPAANGSAPNTPQRTTPLNTPTKNATPARQPLKKIVPQRTVNKPHTPAAQKDNANTPKQRPILPAQAKKNADPKAVIDLTDEDEKNQAPKTTTTASPTVRATNKTNNVNNVSNNNNNNSGNTPKVTNNIVGNSPKVTNNVVTSSASKIMIMSPTNVLARPGSTVMLKVNSNNLVSQPNGVITSVQNGPVSVVATQPTTRPAQQARIPATSVSAAIRSPVPSAKPSAYKHPAPLPSPPPMQQSIVSKKPIPPRPHLNLARSNCGTGIVLQWKMPYKLDMYESIVSYQLYAYQETKGPPKTDNWGKIGDVKALDLPMAVTLTQFAVGNRYFFAVRAVDVLKRLGPFSEPQTILL